MIFSLWVLALSSPLLCLAAAIPQSTDAGCESPKEDLPWLIKRFFYYTADEHSVTPSYIAFEFEDDNRLLELKTTCYKEATPDSGVFSDRYTACQDPTVGFAFNGTDLKVKRSYQATNPPKCDQQFRVTAFGSNKTDLQRAYVQGNPNGAAGVWLYQDRLYITITGLAA